MPFPLLATKLYLPPLRANRVSRPLLVERLNQGLLPGVRLVLVSAPAGFGKTTLAIEWARGSGLPVAWLGLDGGDNDPRRFWQYSAAALQTIDPALGREMAAALDGPTLPPVESLLALLLNDLTHFERPLLWVLDDYHVIENRAIHDGLNFLVDHLPPEIRLVLLTRADPPLQLARRRGRAELVELRAGDLRFSGSEADDFFRQAMHLALTSDDIQALEQRTEGWVAGLQMAAVALQAQPGSRRDFIAAFTGDDRYIADYLVEEVLERQPAEVQRFLLRTAVLERFSVGLCEAVSVETSELVVEDLSRDPLAPVSVHSASMLDYLDRANLFLVPLDNRREWFRYHHLFAQLLRQRARQALGRAALRDLYRKAAEWHLQNGDPGEAVDYALAGGDLELAAGLMQRVVDQMFLRSELTSIRRWAERLPQEVLSRHPSLCVALAWAAIATSYNTLCEELIATAERASQVSVADFVAMEDEARRRMPPEQLGAVVELTVLRSRMEMERGEVAAFLDQYQFILQYLVAERNSQPHIYNLPHVLRGPMVFLVASAQEMLGQLEKAMAGFSEAADLGERLQNIHIFALSLGHLGQIQAALGQLHAAETTFQHGVEVAREKGEHVSAFFGLLHAGLGHLAYERNDLETARSELEHSLRQGKIWNIWEVQIPAYEGLIRMGLVQDDLGMAEAGLAGLEAVSKAVPADAGPLAEAWRVLFWLRQGQVLRAAGWAEPAAARLPGPASHAHTLQAEALARVWLAQGKADLAAELLAGQAGRSAQAKQWSAWLRLEVLRAAALQAAGSRAAALEVLGSVLEQAEREGYQRSFIDEGEPMAHLLRACLDLSSANRGYLTRLLGSFSSGAQGETARMAGLAEALSPRELEIVRLLASDASNAEIATQCYITVNTLKKHISSIYGKLGATTRLQAVQRARQLNLIT